MELLTKESNYNIAVRIAEFMSGATLDSDAKPEVSIPLILEEEGSTLTSYRMQDRYQGLNGFHRLIEDHSERVKADKVIWVNFCNTTKANYNNQIDKCMDMPKDLQDAIKEEGEVVAEVMDVILKEIDKL